MHKYLAAMASKISFADYGPSPYFALGPISCFMGAVSSFYGTIVFVRRLLDRIAKSQPLKPMGFALIGLNVLAFAFQISEVIFIHSDDFPWPLIFRNWMFNLSVICLHIMQIQILMTFNGALGVIKWLKPQHIVALRCIAVALHVLCMWPIYLEEIFLSFYNPYKPLWTLSAGLFSFYAGIFGITTNIFILRSYKANLKLNPVRASQTNRSKGRPSVVAKGNGDSNGRPATLKVFSSSPVSPLDQSSDEPEPASNAKASGPVSSRSSLVPLPFGGRRSSAAMRSRAPVQSHSPKAGSSLDLSSWIFFLLGLDVAAGLAFMSFIWLRGPPGSLLFKLDYLMQEIAVGIAGIHMAAETIVFDAIVRMFSNAISSTRLVKLGPGGQASSMTGTETGTGTGADSAIMATAGTSGTSGTSGSQFGGRSPIAHRQ
ncbi:hypothetical protein BC831DRAFT_461385 [Entophlyctis helioformis]|nr:hypothetical protein BC831DRAFT_461385 [Entophlyctis helioformis]